MTDGPPGAAPRPRPRDGREVFIAFTSLALKGWGGVLPVAQHELVERRGWMTREEFVETLAVAQVLPGPNIINLALMVGDRWFGTRGAFSALAGMLLAPTVLVLVLAALYNAWADQPVVAGALRGMGAAAAGLVIATALKLLPTLRRHPLGFAPALGVAALTLLAIAALRWPLAAVVLGLGGASMWATWWRLGPRR